MRYAGPEGARRTTTEVIAKDEPERSLARPEAHALDRGELIESGDHQNHA